MKKEKFVEKFAWAFALGFVLLGIGFLFAPLLEVETAVLDSDVTVTHLYGLANLLSNTLWNPWLAIVLLGFCILGAVFAGISPLIKKASSNLLIVSLILDLAAICLVIILKEVFGYYAGDYDSLYQSCSLAWGSSVVIVCLALSAFFALLGTKYAQETTVRDIAEDAVFVAAAFVLNFIKFFSMPTGGSVNLQMLPLMLIAVRKGPVHGFVAGGLIYGLLTCLTDGYGFYCYPFDYLLGFGSVAIMGFFRPLILGKGQKTYNAKGLVAIFVSGVLATTIRFLAGCTSSMLFYGSNFGEAALYNVGYVFVSGALAIGILMALYGPLCKMESLFPSKRKEKEAQEG